MIGYSLGGGIAADFTSHFPTLVSSLVLIAPSGLIRPHHIGRSSRIIYSQGIIPESLLNFFVRRRLKTPLYPTKNPAIEEKKAGPEASVAAELPNLESSPAVTLSKKHPKVTIERAVSFQVDNHKGFVQAFMSSIRHGPIREQHKQWQRIGERLSQQDANGRNISPELGLEPGKVLVILGINDPIIKKDELMEDAKVLLHGHEAPVTKGGDVVRHIANFWKLTAIPN